MGRELGIENEYLFFIIIDNIEDKKVESEDDEFEESFNEFAKANRITLSPSGSSQINLALVNTTSAHSGATVSTKKGSRMNMFMNPDPDNRLASNNGGGSYANLLPLHSSNLSVLFNFPQSTQSSLYLENKSDVGNDGSRLYLQNLLTLSLSVYGGVDVDDLDEETGTSGIFNLVLLLSI